MTTETTAVAKREAQVAVAPLNTLDLQDVGRGAAVFDAWLQEVSGGIVTLERIKNTAGALPVVGNIMALVDALSDIVTLTKSQKREMLDWVSLGINLIGVLPAPPTMAAARMSLRPTLFLVRQELRHSAKLVMGDALIEILIGHLNATIVGTIDDFVKQAEPKLAAILKDAGKLGEDVISEIAKGLEAGPTAPLMPRATSRLPTPSSARQATNCSMTPRPPSAISSAGCSVPTRRQARVSPTVRQKTCCPTKRRNGY
ncbi:hypothetical protein [Pseudomonas sp. Irchel 3A18]|uniref:hypothetical protein n=1 Tax=Pseudomonas sp. Irchel 3A18 TaxID=2008905 RepID=UPI0015ADFC4A|nr:hypothetical protein [Pseudomonas sp. Irchel 3A18]